MSPTRLLFIAVALIFVSFAASIAGWAVAFVAAYVMTLGGVTTTLYAVGGDPGHLGIESGSITIYLGDVLLVATVVAIWMQGGRLKIGWMLAGFLIPAVIMTFAVWGDYTAQWSGLKLFATAIISFGVGRWLAENLTEKAALVIALACFVACALQFVVTIAQSRGIELPAFKGAFVGEWISKGRMVGLYDHPGRLGKAILLLFCFLLPLSASSGIVTRRLAYSALALGSVATLLTLSRSNFVAIGIAIVLWVVCSRSASIGTKLGILTGGAILLVLNSASLSGLEARQEQDPDGGPRDHLFAVGMSQIKQTPLTGTGPNYYNEVVGKSDPFAAIGFPIHNSFLHPVVELGIPLSIVLFIPLFMTIARTVNRVNQNRSLDTYSAALLAVLPGVIVIGWTSWSMISPGALPLWFMGFGFLGYGVAQLRGTNLSATMEGAEDAGAGDEDCGKPRPSAVG